MQLNYASSRNLFSLNLTTEMAGLCFSISSLSQYYHYFSLVMIISFIFSYQLYFSYLINISLLLLPLIYHNFTHTFSEPAGSTFLLLPLISHIFPPRFPEHGSGFVVSTCYSDILRPHEELENVVLVDETSCLDVVECEPLSEEINNYLEDVDKIVKAEEEESNLRTRQGVNICDCCDHGNEYGKTSSSVALCVKEFVENDSNLGCTGQEEEWKNTLAWKLFEERHYNMVQGEQGMDLLWEAAFEADSIKSRRIDVVVKNKDMKKKKSGEQLDKNKVNEDQEEEQVEMTSGCLQGFKCCSTGTRGKMNMKRGRSSIVKFAKPLKFINWWRHFKRHTKTNRF